MAKLINAQRDGVKFFTSIVRVLPKILPSSKPLLRFAAYQPQMIENLKNWQLDQNF